MTAIYTVGSVALYVGAALGLALLCDTRLPGVGMIRTVVFIPSLVPVFGMAILWGWLFNRDFGLVNYVLHQLGLSEQGWFQSESQALWMCIAVSFWAIGSAFVVFLAGLQSIPQDLYEAITVDGAGTLRRFWHVTLPMLSPVILFNLVIGMILSFQVFDIAWALTNGGPGDATLFFVLYIWRKAFQEFQMGYASALAWILFLSSSRCTAVIFRTARYWVHYEGAGRERGRDVRRRPRARRGGDGCPRSSATSGWWQLRARAAAALLHALPRVLEVGHRVRLPARHVLPDRLPGAEPVPLASGHARLSRAASRHYFGNSILYAGSRPLGLPDHPVDRRLRVRAAAVPAGAMLFALTVAMLMMPFVVTLIPRFLLSRARHLTDSLRPLIIPGGSAARPTGSS